MRRPALLALAAATTLCACSRQPEPPIGAAPAERAPSLAAAAAIGPPLFVGRWAASRGACAARGWDLTPTSLTSPNALTCELTKAQPTSAGYTVYAVCKIGKAAQPTRLIFTLSGPSTNRSLTLTGGPFLEPMALARCPSGIQSASTASPASSAAPA